VLYAGGDHKEELGREEGARKGGRNEGTGVEDYVLLLSTWNLLSLRWMNHQNNKDMAIAITT